MACYHPIEAYKGEINPKSGKREIVFSADRAVINIPFLIPCGQCIGCRLERSRQWAVRCLHESELYDENCFITLTYDDSNLPSDGSLNVEDFQKFMKRLRKAYPDKRIRFFHCGEYGELNNRPHHHACIFNHNFSDKRLWKSTQGNNLYVSDTLNNLWKKGYCIIGEVTFESAAYVARYITKKILGEKADEHYQGKKPEYITMSRRPGIGKEWFDKFKTDVYPSDFVVVNGKKCHPPKYYDNLLESIDSTLGEKIKQGRKDKRKFIYSSWLQPLGYPAHTKDNTPERMLVKEFCKKEKIKSLKREI